MTDEVFEIGVLADTRDEAIKLLKGMIKNTDEDLATQLYNNMYDKNNRIHIYECELSQDDSVLREVTEDENDGNPVRRICDASTDEDI